MPVFEYPAGADFYVNPVAVLKRSSTVSSNLHVNGVQILVLEAHPALRFSQRHRHIVDAGNIDSRIDASFTDFLYLTHYS